MKTLQLPVSETQKQAMFYHGVIATANGYKLETYQDGEICFEDSRYEGSDTPDLATNDVHDSDIDAEVIVDIFVDKFFAITSDGELVDEDKLVFNDYDEAIEAFKTYLKQ